MAPTHFEMGEILQEEIKITPYSIATVELSLSQSSHGKEVSLVKRSRTKFGRSAPCSSLSKLNTGRILKPRQKLKISEKVAAFMVLTHIAKAPMAPDSAPIHYT